MVPDQRVERIVRRIEEASHISQCATAQEGQEQGSQAKGGCSEEEGEGQGQGRATRFTLENEWSIHCSVLTNFVHME